MAKLEQVHSDVQRLMAHLGDRIKAVSSAARG